RVALDLNCRVASDQVLSVAFYLSTSPTANSYNAFGANTRQQEGFVLLRSRKSISTLSTRKFINPTNNLPCFLQFSIFHGGDFRTRSLVWLDSSSSGRRNLCGYAVEQFSDDEYECDFENQKGSSSVANIDEWKWKLSLLQRSEQDQEIISRDKRDRRDYEQISNLAKRMGLY
ncbi:Atp-dependent rna helicase protein, partial [Thalictrum thalictroides]